jgi:hypothetical protein
MNITGVIKRDGTGEISINGQKTYFECVDVSETREKIKQKLIEIAIDEDSPIKANIKDNKGIWPLTVFPNGKIVLSKSKTSLKNIKPVPVIALLLVLFSTSFLIANAFKKQPLNEQNISNAKNVNTKTDIKIKEANTYTQSDILSVTDLETNTDLETQLALQTGAETSSDLYTKSDSKSRLDFLLSKTDIENSEQQENKKPSTNKKKSKKHKKQNKKTSEPKKYNYSNNNYKNYQPKKRVIF